MSIQKVNSSRLNYLKKYQNEQQKKEQVSSKSRAPSYEDELHISNYSKKLKKIRNKSEDVIDSIENFREKRLPEIREKLKSGFYQKDQIRKETAEALADSFDITI